MARKPLGVCYIYSKGGCVNSQRSEEERASSPHKTDYDGSGASVEVTVRDARGAGMTLDENSFALAEQDTCLATEDFYGDGKIIKEK